MHASSAQVFLSLSGVFPVWAYRVKINHWPFLHVAAHVARESKSLSQTILSLRNAQNVSYHTFCLTSSGAKKHIRYNKICQYTVAQIYRVTPECSARESCDNIGLFLSPHGSCICLTSGTSETAVLIGIHLLP